MTESVRDRIEYERKETNHASSLPLLSSSPLTPYCWHVHIAEKNTANTISFIVQRPALQRREK